MNMAVTIRPITAADIPGYHGCLDTVARERCYLAFLEAPPIGRSERFVRDQLAQAAPMLVAEGGGQIVGWCDVCRLTMPGFTYRGCLLMDVHPDFRGRGIGRRLIEAAILLSGDADRDGRSGTQNR
jgi:GNAT superfamily N-acetyltransferase